MLKLNKKVEYALIALKLIWDKKQNGDTTLTTAREVCERFNLPFDTTAKVMQIMSNAGVLQSSKGVKGGHGLEIDLTLLTIPALALLIEGKTANCNCLQGEKAKQDCELSPSCNIRPSMQWLSRHLQQYLQNITVHDFFLQSFPLKADD